MIHAEPKTAQVLCLPAPGDSGAVEKATEETALGVVLVASVGELLRALSNRPWSATVLSLSAEHMDDDVVRRVVAEGAAGAVFLTAEAVSLERALLMDRVGAVGMLREPLDGRELAGRLSSVIDEGAEVPFPEVPHGEVPGSAPELVGESAAMGAVFETIARVARSTSTVLLTGESGTGKEVAARAIHWASERGDGPFVAVNCAAIPEHLLESELFGHERGAFTGAVARRIGRFERADGGTLFLDEIGDMSLVLQAKALRVLEDRVVERVGGEGSVPVDVRVIAATHQNLVEATQEGRFREDLYFRLAVVDVHLPPLRNRGPDIRRLALHFGAHFAHRHGRSVAAVTERALQRLESAAWRGNVRELRNVMDRAVLLAHGDVIRSRDLRLGSAAPRASPHTIDPEPHGYPPDLALEQVESDHIRRVLQSLDGHIARAASSLGIHRNTLARKMKQYGIDVHASGSAGE